MHLPAPLPRPCLGQELLTGIEGEAPLPLRCGLPDIEAGPDRGHDPMLPISGSKQQRAAFLRRSHRHHGPENHQLMLTKLQRLWRFRRWTQYFVHLLSTQRGIVMTDSSSDVLEHTTTMPGSEASDSASDVSFSERYSEIIGKVNATLDAQDAAPRIGLRGTARIYGGDTTLFYYLLRRPITAARQWLGW